MRPFLPALGCLDFLQAALGTTLDKATSCAQEYQDLAEKDAGSVDRRGPDYGWKQGQLEHGRVLHALHR